MSDISIGIHLPGLAAAKKGIAGIRDDFDRLGKSKGAQSLLMGVGLAAGQMAFNALGSAVSAATDFMADSIAKASDLREAMALTEQVFEDNSDAVKEWAKATDDAFSTREALDFASKFGTAFKNVGMALDETTAKAQEMTTLAGDLGSAFNTSSEEAAVALRSGLLGESEPLRRFGVFLDEAKTKARAAAMGMVILGGKLTDGQKVAARYAEIMEQTADSQGMFGRDTGSLADAQKLLQNNMEDLQAEIGQQLLPVMVDLSRWMSEEGIPLLKDFLDLVGRVGPGIVDYKESVEGATVTGREWAATMQEQRDAAGEMSEAAEEAANKTFRIGSMSEAAAKALEGASVDIGESAEYVKRKITDIGKAADITAGKLTDFKDAALDAMDALAEAAYGPEELTLKLSLARAELKLDEKALRALEQIKDPTREQRADIDRTRLAIIEDRKEVFRLEGRLLALDGLTFSEIIGQVNKLGNKIDWASKQGQELLGILGRVGAAGAMLGLIGASGTKKEGRAIGGPVLPNNTYTVGESGPETLVMGRNMGYVIPGAGGGGGRGGESVMVHTTIQLDGRTVAEVVDRHLAYMAARAPQSPYSG